MKSQTVVKKTPIFSTGLLVTIAIGATLAFLPSVVGLIPLALGNTFGRNEIFIPFIIQAGGALIMLIAFIVAFFKSRKFDIRNAGIVLMMAASFIGLAANLIFAIVVGDHVEEPLAIEYAGVGSIILIFLFLCLSPLMAVGSFMVGKYFTKFKGWGCAFIFLTVVTSAYYVLWGISDQASEATTMENMNRRGYYEAHGYLAIGVPVDEVVSYKKYKEYWEEYWNREKSRGGYISVEHLKLLNKEMSITSFVALAMALLYGTVAAWRLVGAKPKKKLLDAIGQGEVLPAAVTEAVSAGMPDHSQYVPQGTIPVSQTAGQSAGAVSNPSTAGGVGSGGTDMSAGISDDIAEQLMRLDDAGLKEIVDRPAFYNPSVVAKAAELLSRRQAWEKISNLNDSELLSMTMATPGKYPANIVEAASMELYQRNSPLLRNQFLSLSPDIVASIANGTAPAPEGIRLAAKAFLNKNTQPRQ